MLSPRRLVRRAVATHELQKAARLQNAMRHKATRLALLFTGEPALRDALLRAPLMAVTVQNSGRHCYTITIPHIPQNMPLSLRRPKGFGGVGLLMAGLLGSAGFSGLFGGVGLFNPGLWGRAGFWGPLGFWGPMGGFFSGISFPESCSSTAAIARLS